MTATTKHPYPPAAVSQAARLLLSLGNGDYPMSQGQLSMDSAVCFSEDVSRVGHIPLTLLTETGLVHRPGRWTVPTKACIELARELTKAAQTEARTTLGRAGGAARFLDAWLTARSV